MRGILLLTILALTCMFLGAQGECDYRGHKLQAGEEHIMNCVKWTCHADGTVSGLTCPTFACVDQIGYQEVDLSKPYPDCCSKPICKSTETE